MSSGLNCQKSFVGLRLPLSLYAYMYASKDSSVKSWWYLQKQRRYDARDACLRYIKYLQTLLAEGQIQYQDLDHFKANPYTDNNDQIHQLNPLQSINKHFFFFFFVSFFFSFRSFPRDWTDLVLLLSLRRRNRVVLLACSWTALRRGLAAKAQPGTVAFSICVAYP